MDDCQFSYLTNMRKKTLALLTRGLTQRRCTIVGHPGWSVVWAGRYVLNEGGGLLFPQMLYKFCSHSAILN